MADALAIDLHHVTKVYRQRVHALRGVSLQVRHGEVFGLLGPNGAGKSTLVKIMMSVVRPTHADGLLLGSPVGHRSTLARVGYLPENHRFPRYLTGRQVLEFFAALARVDRPTRRRRAGELLAVVGMSDWANARIATYSKGMIQRIGLAQALVHDPDLVVLDEPTDGVDPVGRREILEVLGRLRGQGKTVFVNSHALSELETICDRVAILVKGQVARQGTIDELTVAKQRYEVEVLAPLQSPDELRARLRSIIPAQWTAAAADSALPPAAAPRTVDRGTLGGCVVEIEGPVVRVATTDPVPVQSIIDALRSAGMTVRRVQQVRPSLEDLFFDTLTADPAARGASPGAARVPAQPRAGVDAA